MAQLDANIFLQQKGPDFDQISEGFDRGIRLGDMMKQRKIEEQERAAKKPLEDQRQALEMQRGQAELIANAALGSKDQASYTNNLNILRQKGIDLTGVPETFDPGLVQQYGGMALSTQQRIENQLKEQHYKNEEQNRKLDRGIQYARLDLDRQKADAEAERASAKLAPKSTEQKLASLGAGEKQRLDYAKQGLDAIKRMDDALAGGDNTFSPIGDNDFTKAKREGSEAYGRMQSGGAISLPEEERFDKTAPGATDSVKIQRTKLADQQKMFVDRIKTLGFTPDELGIKVNEIQYGNKSAPPKEGDTKEYQGITYTVINGRWVSQ